MISRFHSQKLFCTLIEHQKKNTTRRDKLISLEQRARNIWERYHFFVAEPNQKPKFFQTFPFPYMNGTLHMGHAFTMTKCDFNAWYKRLCGYNVLFPFGFHCTGMPISAAAKKLSFELQSYGDPPSLPVVKDKQVRYQYNLMLQLGIEKEKIREFKDARHWIKHFPELGQHHVQRLGCHVDLSRSFITTDLNPYFDSFVRWQFTLLKEKGYIKYGKRPSIYSPKDSQICADHDRSQGEGINPEEYQAIKLLLLHPNQKIQKILAGRKIYLIAATLRPETLYGQTSCFLLPSGDYCAVQMKNNEVFICSERSAKNMAYQHLTKEDETVQIITTFKGEQLMGLPLSAPNAIHQVVYTLPMMTISMSKGTGIVTCVPSDSPDDWMAICDLRSKTALRDKYEITEEMVTLQPIQIINIPAYGNLAAVTICQQMKIKSQNDRESLDKAKQQCYKKGFHDGTMIIGNFKGFKVIQAKQQIKKQLFTSRAAFIYYEPSGNVISRTGQECVVSYCDQWYLNYADQQWKNRVMRFVETTFKCNSDTLQKDLVYTINWLREWGCSRSFGLGTKLPFDEQYVIQSLSDSTIYFAYYTVSHLLQGSIDGSLPGILGIRPEELTIDFWNHIFLGKQYLGKIPHSKLQILKQSFLYWYPLDLRCSAKDLIKNHLTMALFNHAAIWEDQAFWPRGYYCNGYINIEGEKMSKSKGNFITIEQALEEYGADASRLACAQAGDSINDANFTKENANAGIMQLSTLEMFLTKSVENKQNYRLENSICPEAEYFDKIFESEIQEQINKVRNAYENMIYRDVVKYGLHDFVAIKDLYLLNCDTFHPRYDLIERYIQLQLLFMYPLCPHFCQTAYLDYFLPFTSNHKQYPSLLGYESFPKPKIQINYALIKSHQYYCKFMIHAREIFAKTIKPRKGQEIHSIKTITIIYRQKFQDYQIEILQLLKKSITNGVIREDWRNQVKIQNKQEKIKRLKFGGFVEKQYKMTGAEVLEENLPFNEKKVLNNFISHIKKQFPYELSFIEVSDAPIKQNKGWKENLANITPGNPSVLFQ